MNVPSFSAKLAAGSTTLLPGQKLAVQLPRLASGLQFDEKSGYIWFAFKDASGAEHKVWLETAESAARKLALASRSRLQGVTVDRLAGTANDARIWEAVRTARLPASQAFRYQPLAVGC